MTMGATFDKARREHDVVAQLATHNAALARQVWDGVTGRDVQADTVGEALRDTMPDRFAALLATDDVAAAYAFGQAVARFGMQFGAVPADASHRIRDMARACWTSFAEQADHAAEIARGFGWDESLAWTTMQDVATSRDDMALVERVARLAGRMYSALRGSAARKIPGLAGEVYSVEQGNDVSRLLPSETALLADDATEAVVLERIVSRRAGQYAVRGETKRSKGPLVVAIDESGSMHGARNEWAKAAAVAVGRVAAEDGRPVAVVHFSTSNKHQRLMPRDPASVVQMVRTFLGGGTAIGLALNVAARQVEDLARKGDRGADVILVTDGVDGNEATMTDALDKLDAMKARLWTVAIECQVHPEAPLRARAAGYNELGRAGLGDGKSVLAVGGAA